MRTSGLDARRAARAALTWALTLVIAGGCASTAPQAQRAAGSEPATLAEQIVEVGKSVAGRAIHVHLFGRGAEAVLILGGFHGNEPTGAELAEALIEYLRANPQACGGRRVAIMPRVNPDGLAKHARTNANHVDINRNFPASNWSRSARVRLGERGGGSDRAEWGERGGDGGADSRGPSPAASHGPLPASEPETQTVIAAVQRIRPARILSIHSTRRGRHCNNYDGPAAALAEAMAARNGYPVRASMGYATPGSFGTWAGVDQQIATVTLELPRDATGEQCWAENRAALLVFINGG